MCANDKHCSLLMVEKKMFVSLGLYCNTCKAVIISLSLQADVFITSTLV